jgi:hypothetical protein
MIFGVSQAYGAATVTSLLNQVPKGAYVNGPGGAADDNYYWQSLHIIFGGAHAANDPGITITLPTDMTIADTDGDTNHDDEVSISYNSAAATMSVTAATTASAIVIDITVGGLIANEDIWVMFPVETANSPSVTSAGYAFDFFTDANDPDIAAAAGPQITYYDPGALSVFSFLANMSADDDSTTANGYMGMQYPNPSVATYGPLTDFIIDSGGDIDFSANEVQASDADDSNDITYYVWVSTDSTLSHVSETEGGVSHAYNYDTPGDYSQNEGAALTDAYYTGGLVEGEYYFYLTSSLTGDFPLARSGKLTVLHYPQVNLMGWDRTGDGFDNTGGHADDANLTLDTGDYFDVDGTVPTGPNSQTDTDLYVSVDDLDDNAQVQLYYSTNTALTAAEVTVDSTGTGITVTGLTGATALVDTLLENQEDTDGFISWNWDVDPGTDSTYIEANSYTLYAIACDGKHFDLQKAQGTDNGDDETISIKHSPNLVFDTLVEYDLGTNTDGDANAVAIDPSQSDVIMISWGKNGITGDMDIDDAAIIELYIDYDDNAVADYGSTDASAIRTAASAAESPTGTHLIWAGGLEEPEGKSLSYYEWNLKDDYEATGWYPVDESGANFYNLYAIIDENKTGGTARVVALGDDSILTLGETLTERLEFDLKVPFARLVDPPAEGVTVNGEETYRLNFNAFDYDEDGDVGIFLVAHDAVISGEIGPLTTTVGDLNALANDLAYCLTSTDGDVGNYTALSEDNDTYFDLTVRLPSDGATLRYNTDIDGAGGALTEGTYWVYIGGDDNGGAFAGGGEILHRAAGTITLVKVAAADAAAQRNMMVMPTHLTVTENEIITFSVNGADNGSDIDRIDAYIAVEQDYWSLVNSTTPFTASTGFAGMLIANTVINDSTAGRWILRLTAFNGGNALTVADADLGETVATFQLQSKGTTNAIEAETSIYYVNEYNNGWVSKFSNNGSDITINSLASNVKVVPRGIIEGICELQGRDVMTDTIINLQLRERDSYVCVPDTMFYNANGGSDTTGVAYTLDSEGKFTLYKVPSGEYDLVAVYDRYLAKSVQVDIYPGIDTLFVSFGQLLGGDCMGYTDSLGAAYPNNAIDAADIGRVSTAFLSTPDSSKWDDGVNNYKWADINEDGAVETLDLSMVTANENEQGAQPVYKTVGAAPGSNADALIEFTNIPGELTAGQTYTIEVTASNLADVRAYFVNLNYDHDALTFAGITKGDFIDAASHSFPVVQNETVGLANSVYGYTTFSGDGVLAVVKFRANKDNIFTSDMLGFDTVSVVNSEFLKESIVAQDPTGIADSDAVPASFNLTQNFPNPFNPTTTISFTIPESANTTLKIYDILGRQVKTLVDGGYSAGTYSVVWDATDMNGNLVSNGVYFYSVKAGKHSETKRMLFMK